MSLNNESWATEMTSSFKKKIQLYVNSTAFGIDNVYE